MEPYRFEKTTFEKYDIDVDFTKAKPLSASTLSSAEVLAYSYSENNPKTKTLDNTILVSTSCSIVGNIKARFTVQAGAIDKRYDILTRATFDNGQKVEALLEMSMGHY